MWGLDLEGPGKPEEGPISFECPRGTGAGLYPMRRTMATGSLRELKDHLLNPQRLLKTEELFLLYILALGYLNLVTCFYRVEFLRKAYR